MCGLLQPIAVILCPGWEKAQTVIDLLEESQTFQVLHPMVILLGLGKDEAKTVKIKNDCKNIIHRIRTVRFDRQEYYYIPLLLCFVCVSPGQVVVTTPFSLVRLLRLHCFLFLRLCHLALDEVDLLFSRAPDEVRDTDCSSTVVIRQKERTGDTHGKGAQTGK